ncbi:MAG: ATP-binding cassette domain-containing protein [Dorea sp.]|nr:ATP-binding cassette domain-containing protein [Dorea sp.]
MALCIDIERKLEDFAIELHIDTDCRRIGILGASGSGKSMTLKMIAGIERPARGIIQADGQVLFDSSKGVNLRPQKRSVGYLFQNYALFPAMTVEQNIGAGLRGKKEDMRKRTGEMIERFGLTGLEKRFPGELSGGQQQRTALARIMAYEPKVILLDEPYAALDMFLRDRLQQELLDMLKGYEGTVILVSHNRDEIYRFSEYLLVMERGKIKASGKSSDIFAKPGNITAARLTGCKNISKVRVLDRHHMEAVDFGLMLHTQREIPAGTEAIGFRAHEFVPVWGRRQENCLKVQIESLAELPFEKQYYLRAENGGGQEKREPVCWFVQKDRWRELEEKGIPDYLKFKEEAILFLDSMMSGL